MDSVSNKSFLKQGSVPIPMMSKNIDIDVGADSVQIGSFGCEGCLVLLYSVIDKTIAVFKYVGSKIKTVKSLDLQSTPGYMFELVNRTDTDGLEYHVIVVHVHGLGSEDLISIKDCEQAKSAYYELDMLTVGFSSTH